MSDVRSEPHCLQNLTELFDTIKMYDELVMGRMMKVEMGGVQQWKQLLKIKQQRLTSPTPRERVLILLLILLQGPPPSAHPGGSS
jgi:hypothetical protein